MSSDTRAKLRALSDSMGQPEPKPVEGATTGFRHRARLAVRGRARSPKIGIFEAGSHRVVHMPNCLVHHPLVNEVAREVRLVLAEHRIPTYSESAHVGSARYLQVVVERASRTAQLVLVTNDETPDLLEPVFRDLIARLGPRLHSLFWNGQLGRGNNVLGPLWHHVHGPKATSEHFGGVRLFYPPAAFGQSHLDLAEKLAASVSGYVPKGARVAEFYAGVGALGLPLVAKSTELHVNEISQGSLAGLALGIAALAEAESGKVHVHAGSAAEHLRLLEQVDVAIADPPRKGLDPELLQALVAHPPERLVYVSCGLSSLIEQAKTLVTSGRWRLHALEAFGLFPYTDHVEVLAVFDRIR